jgi:hypothetical protein
MQRASNFSVDFSVYHHSDAAFLQENMRFDKLVKNWAKTRQGVNLPFWGCYEEKKIGLPFNRIERCQSLAHFSF